MAKTTDEQSSIRINLSRYIERVMEEKNLTLNDVERLSGGKITDAYVNNLVKGKARNPSLDKICALAKGLGVDEEELFRAARGLLDKPLVQHRTDHPSHSLMILRLFEEVVINAELTRILQILVEMSDEDLVAVGKFLEKRRK